MIFNATRGVGTLFGPDMCQKFLEEHGLSLLVRSHEGPDARQKRQDGFGQDMMSGYSIDQVDDSGLPRLITLFSAPDYPQGPAARHNLGAVMKLAADMRPLFIQYDVVAHPSL
eukprot:TRINITY_DN422_c0_g2_i2.p1 TRINITY_DN422_c0_g2~~TRINITY_DN422_c0_g2_i2.p1  ORF type:complete len:113 (+),score=18.25 TRINITY_DN422_c0_g2_i2:655-993(+)